VKAGDVIWNPLSGEKALIVAGAEDTGGDHLESVVRVEAGGFLPGGPHAHDNQLETFTVRQGRIELVVGGERSELAEGETATVPPGVVHEWSNATEGEIEVLVRVEPAYDFELMIMAVWGLCADGLTDARGNPDPLRGALIGSRFRREYRPAKPPAWLQRVLFPPLAALARRRGLDAELDRYADPESHPSVSVGLGHLPEAVLRPPGR
jgi:quercetin dioxygenase-like cupin family protein